MKPEDFRASATRPFTGEEYLASLRDDREIYIYGDRVKDVTSHPAFRNAAASMARLYDALHDPQSKEKLCWETDTGNGGYTHKFFRYARSADELRQQRDAIAEWSRLTYGWMGRTPDYKAAFGSALGANPGFYGRFEDNAKTWYKRIQEACLYLNHAIVNPPIDRDKPVDQVKDVFISVDEEVDGGIVVSGAKVVATNSALTHYNFVGQGSAQLLGNNTDFALMFIAPMNTPGMKLICRPSYELVAGIAGSPFDYPLSSRFDENDAILVMDKVFIPWENVLIYRDFERCKQWFPQGGFGRLFPMQGCTRLAVKLDFITGALYKALQCTGSLEFRGVQAQVARQQVAGEVLAAGRGRNHRVAQLHRPGQRHLGDRGPVPGGYPGQRRVLQHLAVGQGHVRGDRDALLLEVGGQRAVLQVRAEFDLVGGYLARTDRGDGLAGQFDVEVGDADPPGQAQGLGFRQRRHVLPQLDAVAGCRPMDQDQVQPVGAQFLQTLAQAGEQLFAGVVVDPDLGGEEQLGTRYAALGDRAADIRLVAVDLRGIDGAIAQFEGAAHRVDDDLASKAEGAETEGREGVDGGRHGCAPWAGWLE